MLRQSHALNVTTLCADVAGSSYQCFLLAASAVTDRVLSFVTTRRHLLFFYSYPQGIPTEPIETMLRRHGNDMVYELEMFLQGCQREGIHFPATVHPYFLQGPTSYVPFTCEAPALPHVLVPASVCRCWFQSITMAVCGRYVANVHHLLRSSQLRHDTSEWIHRSCEDRFRFRAWLIDEINVCRITNPMSR